MRRVIRKFFWLWQFEEEEKWLNKMAAKGLCLVAVGWCRYEFEECEPGEYGIKLEMLEHMPTHPDSVKYLNFLEETGAEQIDSYLRWVYFRKKKVDGEFELFSDNASRIQHFTRILRLITVLGAFNLYFGLYNLICFLFLNYSFNLICLLNLAIGVLCAYGFIKYYKIRKKLKKDQMLFE